MLETNYQPGMAQTRTQGNAMPDPVGAGGYKELMDSFIQKRLSDARGGGAPTGSVGVGGTMRRGDQSRNRATEGRTPPPVEREMPWYSIQGAARTPVTGFNMGGGYTIDPNKLPPSMRPGAAGMIPGTAVPTGSIQSPDMQQAADSVQNTGLSPLGYADGADQPPTGQGGSGPLNMGGDHIGQPIRPIERPRAGTVYPGRAPSYR